MPKWSCTELLQIMLGFHLVLVTLRWRFTISIYWARQIESVTLWCKCSLHRIRWTLNKFEDSTILHPQFPHTIHHSHRATYLITCLMQSYDSKCSSIDEIGRLYRKSSTFGLHDLTTHHLQLTVQDLWRSCGALKSLSQRGKFIESGREAWSWILLGNVRLPDVFAKLKS